MPAPKSWGEHGTVRRYRQGGCAELEGGVQGTGERCADCRDAIREFQSRNRAGVSHVKKRMSLVHGKSARNNVTPMTPRDDDVAKPRRGGGPVEQSVREQLSEYAIDQPVRVQMALAAARILDNPDRVALHMPATRQLEGIVEKLTAGQKKKSRGRLSVVQAMTARR